MTREEAIETVRRCCPRISDSECDFETAMRVLIPELTESEDERIRKEMLAFFRNFYETGTWKAISDCEKWIAYLEKQKEEEGYEAIPVESTLEYKLGFKAGRDSEKQKDASKAIEAVERIDKYIDEHLANAHDMKDSNPDKKYYRGWDDALGKMSGILQDVYSGEKREEKKSINQSNTELAEEEKTRFVSGQFLQCKLSFDEFKEGEHYWLEYVGDDMYVGRSDNVLNQKFHVTPRQLYTLFSQQLEEVQGPPQEEKQVPLNYEPPFDENPSDKEIIEALIHQLREQVGFLTAIDGVSTKAIMCYLEKQKEQDKCPEYCVRSHCIGCSIYEKQKEQKPILEVFGFKVGDAVRLKDGDGRKHIIKSFEEVEGLHGPNFYHVEFEDDSARDGIYPGEEYPNGYYTQMEKFEEEQKPAGWSEEDRRTIDRACVALRAYANGELPDILPSEILEYADKLQSLRPQKLDASKLENFDPVEVLHRIKKEWPMAWEKVVEKAEWSEEDSKRYISIATTLETSVVLSKEDYDANMAWLRNLVYSQKYSRPRSHCKPSEEKYDGNMDKECIKLCDILNSIPSIDTFESCCGHLKDRYSIWFFCNDIITISRLGRCVERNYSDGKWELLVDSTDTHPTGVFWLRSKVPFQSYEEMEKSVNELCNGIQYWFNAKFDSYFNARLGIIETTQ